MTLNGGEYKGPVPSSPSPLVTTLEPYWQGLFHKRVYRNANNANTLGPIQGTESGGGFLDFRGGLEFK